jgi:cell division protein ZapA
MPSAIAHVFSLEPDLVPVYSRRRYQAYPRKEAAVATYSSTKHGPDGARRAATEAGEAHSGGSVSVSIRGKALSLRTDHDPAFVQSLAHYLDRKVSALAQQAPHAPFDKLLMLASLTVAEELFQARQELDGLREEIKRSSAALLDLLDADADEDGFA